MEKLIASIVVFFGSAIKFSFFTFTAMLADLGIGGSLANLIGGVVGIVLFTYLGTFIQDYLIKRFPGMFGRKFTRSTRFLVKVKQRFGLNGVAALTPVLLSIPVGVMFALALTHDKKKIMITMITSILFWAAVIGLPLYLFNFNVAEWLKAIAG